MALQGDTTNRGRLGINNPLNVTGNLSVQLTPEQWDSLKSSFPNAFAVYMDFKAGSELFLYTGGISMKLVTTPLGQEISVELPALHEKYSEEYRTVFDKAYETIGISLKGLILEIYLDCTLVMNICLLGQPLLTRDIFLSGPVLVSWLPHYMFIPLKWRNHK